MNLTTTNRQTLKGFFQAGEIPTEQQFASLIDGMVNMMDDKIAKVTGIPLSIQAELDPSASVLDFYHNLNDNAQAWRIGLKSGNNVGFSILDKSSASRFYIDGATGRVGIGNSNPQAQLQVTGNIESSGNIKGQSLDINSGANVVSVNTTGFVGIGALPDATSKLYVAGDIKGQSLTLNSGVNGVTINNSGFIGVGAAIDPSARLYVAGNVKAQTLSITSGSGVTINTLGFMGIGAAPDSISKLYVAGDIKGQSLTLNSGINGVSINSTGFVGIGALPDPASKLYVNGDIKAQTLLINTSYNGLVVNSNGRVGIGALPDAASRVYVNGDILINSASSLITSSIKYPNGYAIASFDQKGMTMKNDINLNGNDINSINANNDGLRLSSNFFYGYPKTTEIDNNVYGSVELQVVSNANAASRVVKFTKGKATMGEGVDLEVSSGRNFNVFSGSIGSDYASTPIMTFFKGATPPSNNVKITGTLTATGAITPNSSDFRLKENIVALKNSLQNTLSIAGVSFDWKDKERNKGKRDIGFIAQEVEKYYPELVSEDDEGYKRLNYDGFTAILVEAVKELNSKVELLQKKILSDVQ